jgi:poly(A) polymerase
MARKLTIPSPAAAVVRGLTDAGYEALIAGGAVRDLLLGRDPGDFDVATSARPEQVEAVFSHVVPVGERFGVVLVLVRGEPVEVATFRFDAEYADGRRPVAIRFSETAEEDARRRDFTVNGLFLDPRTGAVLDHVGGREDLSRGLLRAIGDPKERFDEDRLRMLRAVRLAAALGFEVEARTWAAMRARCAEISSVSGERIRDELLKTLTGPRPRRGVELLAASGLLEVVLPEVAAMIGVMQPPRFHPEGDVYQHTLLALSRLEAPSPVLAMATLLHDVGKPATRSQAERVRFDRHAGVGAAMAEDICRRLRFSRREGEAVAELVRDHLRFMSIMRMREARRRRFLTGERAAEHLALHRADCLASHGDLSHHEFAAEARRRYEAAPPPPPRLVTGRDLIEAGLTPGPIFARILSEVEDLVLEDRLRTREEALGWVRSRIESGEIVDED